jgi:hypothetical protein
MASRKNRNRNRKESRKNRMYGGDPALVNDTSMALSSADSLAQGQQFAGLHSGQHGGFANNAPAMNGPVLIPPPPPPVQMGGAGIQLVGGGGGAYPASVVGSTLPSDMVASARTGPINAAIAAIQGMKDQAGGRRRRNRSNRKNRKNRKTNRKNRCYRSNRNRSNRNRRQMGGGELFTGSCVNANTMLLPSGMEKQAALNYEWSLASDPSAFAPKQ